MNPNRPTEEEAFNLWIGLGESKISDEDRHFFDISGYLLLQNVLPANQVARARESINALSQASSHGVTEHRDAIYGRQLVNIIEAADVVEDAMALSQVLQYVEHLIWGCQYRLVGSRALLRDPGESTPLTQGGAADPRRYARYRCFGGGQFRCLMITSLIALYDTVTVDGAFSVIPGSHKSNLPHPYGDTDLANVPPLKPIELRAGSAVLFTENLSHAFKTPASKPQTWLAYHYGPSFMVNLPGCDPSESLTARTKDDAAKAHLLQQPYYHPVGSQR